MERWRCPKCELASPGDWSGCNGSCPLEMSPHFNADIHPTYNFPVPHVTTEGDDE